MINIESSTTKRIENTQLTEMKVNGATCKGRSKMPCQMPIAISDRMENPDPPQLRRLKMGRD